MIGTGELLVTITPKPKAVAVPEAVAVAAPETMISEDKVAAAVADVDALATKTSAQVEVDKLQDLFTRLFSMAETVATARQVDPTSTVRAEKLAVTAAVVESLISRLADAHLD